MYCSAAALQCSSLQRRERQDVTAHRGKSNGLLPQCLCSESVHLWQHAVPWVRGTQCLCSSWTGQLNCQCLCQAALMPSACFTSINLKANKNSSHLNKLCVKSRQSGSIIVHRNLRNLQHFQTLRAHLVLCVYGLT